MNMVRFVGILTAICILTPMVDAADWPQYLGPNRNGVSTETGLLQTWGKDGPPLLWSIPVGEGFSGPVIAGDKLILFHRVGDEEVVDCLNADTGKKVWSRGYATDYRDQLNKGDGPRSTPAIHGDLVITLGAGGWLNVWKLADGAKVWGRNINDDYRVPQSYFGVGTSPLVEKDLLLINVGGKEAGIVAFALQTGKEVWHATTDEASYSSPVMATVEGARHAVFFTRFGVSLLDPKDGTERFRKRWRARYAASVNAATPLVIGDKLFVSTSYETGALLLRLHKDGADTLYEKEDAMTNHYNTSVYRDGCLYGFDGRQEAGPNFRCVDLDTGKIRWNKDQFGCGTMVLAEGKLIVLTESGELLLVDASPQEYRERARAAVFNNSPCRAQIALAGGRLYGRDQRTLKCWDLRPR